MKTYLSYKRSNTASALKVGSPGLIATRSGIQPVRAYRSMLLLEPGKSYPPITWIVGKQNYFKNFDKKTIDHPPSFRSVNFPPNKITCNILFYLHISFFQDRNPQFWLVTWIGAQQLIVGTKGEIIIDYYLSEFQL